MQNTRRVCLALMYHFKDFDDIALDTLMDLFFRPRSKLFTMIKHLRSRVNERKHHEGSQGRAV